MCGSIPHFWFLQASAAFLLNNHCDTAKAHPLSRSKLIVYCFAHRAALECVEREAQEVLEPPSLGEVTRRPVREKRGEIAPRRRVGLFEAPERAPQDAGDIGFLGVGE